MAIADQAVKGGKARASKLTAEMRKASASKAARARWDKKADPASQPDRPTPDRTELADIEFDSETDPHMGRN